MKRALAVTAVILAVLLGGQGQALAADFEKPFEDEMSYAIYEPDPHGEYCSSQWLLLPVVGLVEVARGCFTRNGDIFRIKDGWADGDQTFIYWENWLWSGTGPAAVWKPYRSGWCNNDLSAPNWGQCNKDFFESSSVNYYGGKGSKIRFQVCRRSSPGNNCNPGTIGDAPWINNNR